MECEIRDLISQLDVKDQLLQEHVQSNKDLEQQVKTNALKNSQQNTMHLKFMETLQE
jgi:hypothetical protein